MIYISFISDFASELQSPSSWLMRTMLSLELTLLLWEHRQDMNCACTATTTLGVPPARTVLCYKSGTANRERNTSAQAGRREELI